MDQQKKERIFISYKRVDKERVYGIKDGIEKVAGKGCCAVVALEELDKYPNISNVLNSSKVFIVVYSSNYASIEKKERYWVQNTIEFFTKSADKHIVLITLDSLVLPKWLDIILPRQQVTNTQNEKSMQVFYRTIQERLESIDLMKRKVLPIEKFLVGNLYYLGREDRMTVEVVGCKQYSTQIVIPTFIQYEGFEYEVVGIGKKAFYNSETLSMIHISNSIKYIDDMAFSNCYSLSSMSIPNSITELGREVFANCKSLTILDIPRGLRCIGEDAFIGCYSLVSIVVDAYNDIYDSREGCNAIIHTLTNTLVFANQYSQIPNTITCIGQGAFKNNLYIEEMLIPNSVITIEDNAFLNCSSLKSISIPDSVIHIGESAFKGCTSLLSIYLSEKLTTIDDATFCGCSSLMSIILPMNIVNIHTHAFAFCDQLKKLIICCENLVYVDSNAFCFSGLETIYIPKGTKNVMQDLFNGYFIEEIKP